MHHVNGLFTCIGHSQKNNDDTDYYQALGNLVYWPID